MALLNLITKPEDLKKLKIEEIERLAHEIRQKIIKVVSKNGGHLASNLGTVELSLALHYVFNSPRDDIIWDVGHQTYTHKILTGRLDRFNTIRKFKGLSGFQKFSESEYDSFTTGHSGTSISAALGIAFAKEYKKDNSKVIAVIGDGSMTSGLSFEGLNLVNETSRKLIVILNDNKMSISKNVGALSEFFRRKISIEKYMDMKKGIEKLIKQIKLLKNDIFKLNENEDAFINRYVTLGMYFSVFNLCYIGPIQGHKICSLVEILNKIKSINKPVLLHILTKKGKGYLPAENDPVRFHGCDSFNIEDGKKITPISKETYGDIFGKTLIKLAAKDKRIVVITPAMKNGTSLSEFSKIYPNRFFDVGISEQHSVTFSAGLAVKGLKPIVAVYSSFLQRAYDQVIHDVCIEKLPVIFAIDRGGLVGEDGPTHHGIFDLSYLRAIPNIIVMSPKDEIELQRMMATAVNLDVPVAIRYPKGQNLNFKPLLDNPSPIDIGKAEVLYEGNDIIIFAIGATTYHALEARKKLLHKNIYATVVNSRFVKPLDQKLIKSLAAKIPYIITVEDNVLNGGFGSAVAEALVDSNIEPVHFKRLGIDDIFVEHGDQKSLYQAHGIDSNGIENAAKCLLLGGKNYSNALDFS